MASASDHRAHAALQPADCLILLPQRLPAAAETSIGPAHYPAECTQSDAFLQPSLRARNGRANSNSFLDLDGFEDESEISGLPHLILSHGYQQLSFAHVGVLHPEPQRFGWIYRTPNLLKEIHVVETEMPAEEAADAEAVVTLRDGIARWVREQDR